MAPQGRCKFSVNYNALERDMMIAAATVSSNRPADHNASPSIRGCAPTTGLCAFVTMVSVTSNDRLLPFNNTFFTEKPIWI